MHVVSKADGLAFWSHVRVQSKWGYEQEEIIAIKEGLLEHSELYEDDEEDEEDEEHYD